VRLLSKDVRFIAGESKDASGKTVTHQNPIDIPNWQFGVNDPYLRGWEITNPGKKNSGLKGDVLLSWFRVLDESFDGPAKDEIYIMVTNALVAPDGSAADCRQRICLNFLFNNSKITAVQRLSRETGRVETVRLNVLPNSPDRRQLVLELDGGTAELFKFDTGAPFVGMSGRTDTAPARKR